ncbi:hypothetical protein H4R18_001657 [Coemansia javaensis]|uniref:Uncharacterized protein n=1 Tax=Coemansia javaensis TaxID=2761396 RepID=A0A9W8HJ07_9FUNG|nr:hypothetical protein H4R18_001657 [Coemansia javaensis]
MSSSRAKNNNVVAVYMRYNKKALVFPATGTFGDLKIKALSGFKIYGDGMMMVPDGATEEPAPSTRLSTLSGVRFRLCPRSGAKYIKLFSASGARADLGSRVTTGRVSTYVIMANKVQ